MILIGAKDDWTPASRCEVLLTDNAVAGEAELMVYPDAYHSFDIDGQPPRYVQGTGVGGKVEAHFLKTDPDAAWRRPSRRCRPSCSSTSRLPAWTLRIASGRQITILREGSLLHADPGSRSRAN